MLFEAPKNAALRSVSASKNPAIEYPVLMGAQPLPEPLDTQDAAVAFLGYSHQCVMQIGAEKVVRAVFLTGERNDAGSGNLPISNVACHASITWPNLSRSGSFSRNALMVLTGSAKPRPTIVERTTFDHSSNPASGGLIGFRSDRRKPRQATRAAAIYLPLSAATSSADCLRRFARKHFRHRD